MPIAASGRRFRQSSIISPELIGGVAPVHPGEDLIVAALQGNMQMGLDIWPLPP